jgi:hypothetical protein
VNFATVV